MGIPSGSGTEVLKVQYASSISSAPTVLINGVADHIYTILSIIICESGNAAEIFHLKKTAGGGGTEVNILAHVNLGAYETYVFNDKFVLSGTDEITLSTSTSANLHCVTSYIGQDWT